MTEEYVVPASLMYTKEHEWAQVVGDAVRVGVTDYAAKTLNDIVYISLPPVGQAVRQSASFGTIESIKAVSELYSPFSGNVTKVNSELSNHPELVNTSPYGEGWIMEISASNLEIERNQLLSPQRYEEYLASLKK